MRAAGLLTGHGVTSHLLEALKAEYAPAAPAAVLSESKSDVAVLCVCVCHRVDFGGLWLIQTTKYTRRTSTHTYTEQPIPAPPALPRD